MTPPVPVPPRAPVWRRRRVGLAVALGALLLSALLWTLARGVERRGRPQPLTLAPQRTLEVRLGYPGASDYRPPGVLRSPAGLPIERLPPGTLERMAAVGDFHGLAVGALLEGDPSRAAEAFGRAGASLDEDSDRAALAFSRGAWEDALVLLERVLKKDPRHPQALWNRGLVLRELGLDLTAASSFRQVARLGEPGWSGEAEDRAQALIRQWEERVRRLAEARTAGWSWVEGEAPHLEPGARLLPGVARTFLYLALWSAPTAERVRALLPVARELDSIQGGEESRRLVERLAGHDFRQRGPLALSFAQALHEAPSPLEGERWLQRIEASRERDLLLGALPLLGRLPERLPEYADAVSAVGDPWFAVKVELWHAERQWREQGPTEAVLTLEGALPECERRHLGSRCLEVELRRCEASLAAGLLIQVRTQGPRALARARAESEVDLEQQLLVCLGRPATTALDRAYAEEALARQGVSSTGHPAPSGL